MADVDPKGSVAVYAVTFITGSVGDLSSSVTNNTAH